MPGPSKVQSRVRSGRSETLALAMAIVSYSFLVVLQIAVYLLTNVLVIFANALEMLSDVLVSVFLLLSVRWSMRPPDESFMFGHGRAQNVGALISGAILIFYMSVETFRQAIPRLLGGLPSEPQDVSWAMLVVVIGMIVIALPVIMITRVRGRGASLKAQSVSLLKDEFAYAVTLVALLFVGQGYPMADTYATLIVGALIAYTGLYLFKDNIRYLAGKSPGKEVTDKIVEAAESVSGVLGVHSLRAEYVGPGLIHADFHVTVAPGTPIEEVNRISSEVEGVVSREANCQYCAIHVDTGETGDRIG